jgi:hypothetical protein
LHGDVGRKVVTEIKGNDKGDRTVILTILTSTLKMEIVYSSETLVSTYKYELVVSQLREPQSEYSPL